jgi:hypothetical protein
MQATNSETSTSFPNEPPGVRRRCWIIFLLTIAIYLLPSPVGPGHFLLTKSRADSWNDQVRIATVESLAEHGTMAIDRTKWGWFSGDKVFLRDHFYSTKPPLLSVVGAVSYWIEREVVKLATGHEITYLKNEDIIYPWVTLTTVVLAFALLLVFFYRALFLVDIPQKARWWLFWALAVGSLYPAYSTIFNNHTVAGSGMFIAFYYILRYRLGGPFRWWEAVIAGLAIGFAGITDFTGALPFLVLLFVILALHEFGELKRNPSPLPQKGMILAWIAALIGLSFLLLPKIGTKTIAVLLLTPVAVGFIASVYLAIKQRPLTLIFLLTLLLPVIAHLFFNSRVTGSWLPTYIQSDVYIATPPGYFGEVITPEEAGILFWARWKYIGTTLFGIRGVFLYTPTLLIGVVGLLVVLFCKGDKLRAEAIAVALTVLAGWGWVLMFGSPNFGGTSFGFRYALPAVPLLIFFSYIIFKPGVKPIWATIFRNAVAWSVVVALIAIPYPWGIFGELPQTQNSIVGNLSYIAINTLFGTK